jgi:regulatory associated protein of mTOR
LILLGRFLDLGPWAVQLSLSIGIFPYVLKLLQSAAQELKPVMIFIWTRVLAVDITCQQDLIKDSAYNYFAQVLKPTEGLPVVDVEEHRAMCAFILAMLCRNYKPGQIVCNSTDIMGYCLAHLDKYEHPLLRQWACLCISQLWQDLPEGKWKGIRENAPAKLAMLMKDDAVEVRAAMVHAMTTFIGIPDLTDEVARIEESIAWTMLDMISDGSPIVRKELLVFLSVMVSRYENKFLVTAHEQLLEEKEHLVGTVKDDGMDLRPASVYGKSEDHRSTAHTLSRNTVFAACWKHILVLSVDPHPEVQRDAMIVVDYVHNALLESALGAQAQSLMEEIQRRAKRAMARHLQALSHRANSTTNLANGAAAQPFPSPGILKRTASYLFAPFFGAAAPGELSTPSSPTSPTLQRTGSVRSRYGADFAAPPEQNDQATAPANYHIAEEPVSKGYVERDLKEAPHLPLTSTFLDWSTEYFKVPQMRPIESEEPGSNEYNERLWRRARNESILRDTQPQKSHAGTHKWNTQLGLMNNGAQPGKMTFHQFEDHLVVADDANTVYVWDWKRHTRLARFSNGNPEGSKISDMKFINEDDQAFLMTGSSDGVLRVYRNYEDDSRVDLAASWRALTDMVPSNVNAGMVFDWQQANGQVLVAGDLRVIRIWNAGTETCTHDIPARSGSCVTSLTSDQMTGNIFVAGFGDGAIRVFDTRQRPQDSMVRKWREDKDKQWVRSVHMQRGGQRELLSASRNGKVRLWDIRMDEPLHVFRTTKDTLRTASTHEHLPVFAV